MGNNVCCEQHNTEDKAMDQLQPQTMDPKRSAIRSDKSKVSEIKHHSEVREEYIPAPQLTQAAQFRFNSEKFFHAELQQQKNPQTQVYGQDTYVGDFDHHKKPHGLGRMYKPNGNLYVGYFQNGKAQGKGVFLFADSSFYRGDFNNNQAETKNGEYVSDHLNYRGGFKNNKFEGEGKQSGINYNFEGTYENGARKQGRLAWINQRGQQYEYTGTFNNQNQMHGRGILKEPNGEYEGQFAHDQKHGEGKYYSNNAMIFQGSYVNGYREGFGIIYNKDKTVFYKGEISKNLPHGHGVTQVNGQKIESTWIEGIDCKEIRGY